jgi:antitoxin (DNA-binding transcriptional repressor) of toxin-antitoxin stability system
VTTTLSVQEAQGQLSQLLELAQAGHEVIIQDAQKGKAASCPLPRQPCPDRAASVCTKAKSG